MIRRQIRDFKMSFGDYRDIPCTAPCSLYSTLKAGGFIDDPYYGRRAESLVVSMAGNVSFTASFTLDAGIVARKHAYLRLSGIDSVAEIYLGDSLLGRTDSINRVYTYDVKGLLSAGENILTVKCLSDGIAAFGRAAFTLGGEYSAPIPDMGILGEVELLTFNNAVIDNVAVTQKHADGSVTLGIKLDMLGDAEGMRAVATLVSAAGQVYYGGITRGYGSITVRDPLYWWPNGLGVQNLYKLTVNLYGDTDVEDTRELRIGLRTLTYDKSEGGTRVKINGISMLPMGALYTPECNILSQRSASKASAVISAAKDAGINSLIVSSEGVYPSDELLSLCDKNGILLFQEIIMGADGTVGERESIVEGFSDQLARIATHPSVAVIIDSQPTELSESFFTTCHNKAPDLAFVAGEDARWNRELPSSISYPSERTLAAIGKGRELNLFSELVEWHTSGKNLKLMEKLSARYPYPTSQKALAYVTELSQANEACEHIEAARLAAGRWESPFYSRLVDARPSISDGSLDYFIRPKALHYRAASFLAPLSVIAREDGGRVAFFVSNERRSDFVGQLYFRLLDNKNNTILAETADISVSRGGAREVLKRDLLDDIRGHECEYYVEYGVKEGTAVINRGTVLFKLPKYFNFVDPKIRAMVSGVGQDFSVTLSAHAYARGVRLDFEGVDAIFDDNFFDITSPAPMKIRFRIVGGAVSAEHLASSLRITTVYDIAHP